MIKTFEWGRLLERVISGIIVVTLWALFTRIF